jgi:hypothetical protein
MFCRTLGALFWALWVPFGAFKPFFVYFLRGFGAVFARFWPAFWRSEFSGRFRIKLVSLSEYNNFSVFTKRTSLIENRYLKTQV